MCTKCIHKTRRAGIPRSADWAAVWTSEELWCNSWQRQKSCVFSKTSKPALKPTKLPFHWATGVLFLVVELTGGKPDHSSYPVPRLRMSGPISPLLLMLSCHEQVGFSLGNCWRYEYNSWSLCTYFTVIDLCIIVPEDALRWFCYWMCRPCTWQVCTASTVAVSSLGKRASGVRIVNEKLIIRMWHEIVIFWNDVLSWNLYRALSNRTEFRLLWCPLFLSWFALHLPNKQSASWPVRPHLLLLIKSLYMHKLPVSLCSCF